MIRFRALRGRAAKATAFVLGCALGGDSFGCSRGRGYGAASAPAGSSAAVAAPSEAQWQDAFERRPEFVVAVRPRALTGDATYGPLLRRALELARLRGLVSGKRMLEALENAEEVFAALPRRGDPEDSLPPDLLLILRGVPADLDPATVVDDDGRLLWKPGPPGQVRELVHGEDAGERAPDGATSLFELPGRTWVVAAGDARVRARNAFARPSGRPQQARLEVWGAGSLASLRIDGSALVRDTPALRPGGGFAAVGQGLLALSLELLPGALGKVRVALSYTSRLAADASERTLRTAEEAVKRKRPQGLAWLFDAEVKRASAPTDLPASETVLVEAPVPPELAARLLFRGPRGAGAL